MIDDVETSFKKIIEHLGLDFNQERFNTAIKVSSFKHLQLVENNGAFKEKPESNNDVFFKYGTYGKGKELLSDEQQEKIITEHMKTMLKYKYI